MRSLRYSQVDLDDPDSVARVILGDASDSGPGARPVAAYLALPPAQFTAAVTATHRTDVFDYDREAG